MTRKLASRGHAALGDPLPARAPTIASFSPLAPQIASSAEGGTATSTLVAVDGVDLVVWSAGAGGRVHETRRRGGGKDIHRRHDPHAEGAPLPVGVRERGAERQSRPVRRRGILGPPSSMPLSSAHQDRSILRTR